MEEKNFGLRAEEWIAGFLQEAGYQCYQATRFEDHKLKIDFWVKRKGQWLPIQFTINHQAIVSEKGIDALRRGVIPSWLEDEKLEEAANGWPQLRRQLVDQFWKQVDAVLESFSVKLRQPDSRSNLPV